MRNVCARRQMDVHMNISAKVYGRPAQMDTAWSAPRASSPPALMSPVATAPSVKAQNTFCISGGFGSPLAEMMSSTYDPESEEVMKYSDTPTTHRRIRNCVTSP